jgi:hypothetical protein
MQGDAMATTPLEYRELAISLQALAATAKDPDAAAQLRQLANRYEKLAARADEFADRHLPMTLEDDGADLLGV